MTCEQQFLKVKAKIFLHQITVRVRFLFIWLPSAHLLHPWTNLPSSKEFPKEIFSFFIQRMCSGVNVRCTTATTCRQEKDVKHEKNTKIFRLLLFHTFLSLHPSPRDSHVLPVRPHRWISSENFPFVAVKKPFNVSTHGRHGDRVSREKNVPRCCRVKTAQK